MKKMTKAERREYYRVKRERLANERANANVYGRAWENCAVRECYTFERVSQHITPKKRPEQLKREAYRLNDFGQWSAPVYVK